MHETIASVFSIALTALGLSYLLRARAWARVYVEFEMHPARFIPIGMLMFIIGLFVAISFNDWSATWPIFITAFGWLMALEGGLLVLKPALLGGFTRLLGSRLVRFIQIGGILVFGLGILLCWEYLLRDVV